MRYFLYAIGPFFLVPIICFAMLHYPALDHEVQARLPLLSAYYISRQLAAEISHADSRRVRFPSITATSWKRTTKCRPTRILGRWRLSPLRAERPGRLKVFCAIYPVER